MGNWEGKGKERNEREREKIIRNGAVFYCQMMDVMGLELDPTVEVHSSMTWSTSVFLFCFFFLFFFFYYYLFILLKVFFLFFFALERPYFDQFLFGSFSLGALFQV